MRFNDLSIQDKAAVIKLGVGGGLRSLRDILLFYDDSISIKPLGLRVGFGNQFDKADFIVPSGSLYGVPMYPMGLRYNVPMLSEMEVHRNQYNIDTERKNRLLYMESSGNPNAYNSDSRATGLYLITPIAHKEYMNYNPKDVGDLYDPVYNARVRDWLMKHFNDTTRWGDYYDMDDAERQRVIYAKYNWGPGNVNDTIRKYGSDWLSHTPLETRNYVNFIIDKIDAGKYKTNEKYNEFMDSGNNNITYAKGGSIHIKPENRGKFTRLKKRTGHSATWFKQHGTPAQKKMATFALNARKWHHKHPDGGPNDTIQTPNLVIDKYIGTKYDPTIWSNKNFLIKYNIQENQNAQLVGDYFRSYANSKGAQRILNNQLKWYSSYHPIRDRWYGRMIYGNPENGGKNAINQLSTLDSNGVFDLEDDVRISKHRSNHNHVATFIGVYAPNYGEYRYEDDYEYPEGLVLPHELMHRLNDNVLHGAQSEALNLNRNTVINGHDEFNNEKYGDLQGLKFLLYDNGIYDSRGNKDATADDIEKLRLLYPYLRPLLLMDNEKAAWMINHVVDNNNFRNDYINKVAYGGQINPFSYLPISEVRY